MPFKTLLRYFPDKARGFHHGHGPVVIAVERGAQEQIIPGPGNRNIKQPALLFLVILGSQCSSLGKLPSAREMINTIGHSSPFAWWMVLSFTGSRSSLPVHFPR